MRCPNCKEPMLLDCDWGWRWTCVCGYQMSLYKETDNPEKETPQIEMIRTSTLAPPEPVTAHAVQLEERVG